ncbi:hypothetical protein HPP92_006777 [Vanilla planifolia]|uniref:Rhodanese domain-containing protein n=1 Tax=Vanilla planifolia TaxID=51239 RepID=A0A835RJ19_VANPL|nr:hypothetical protein HPP92_007033 [Vanilla planifolia]KAG0489914.1 hypothetical protein HPP92_006777 [Vanilla planifolia]
MLPICSAAPSWSSSLRLNSGFLTSSHSRGRIFCPLRASEHGYFIDEQSIFYDRDGYHVQATTFKAQATKFAHSLIVEKPDLSASSDSSIFSPYPSVLDDIVRGFSNENFDEEPESLLCLVNERFRSCPHSNNLKYVDTSELLGSNILNGELSSDSIYRINYQSTLFEELAPHNLDSSPVAASTVHLVVDIPDSPDVGWSRLSTLISSEALTTSNTTTPKVALSYTPDLKENIQSFFSGMEDAFNNLLQGADNSVNSTFSTWKLLVSDQVKNITDIYDGVLSSIYSSIDNSKVQINNQLADFLVKFKENISSASSVALDTLRWMIRNMVDSLSNDTAFVIDNYASSKTFLPPDIRNFLNMFESEAARYLRPVGSTLQQVYEAIEKLERNVGVDTNDPIVPFFLVLGSTATIAVLYWFLRYGGYAGDLSPEQTLDLIKNDKDALLVDVRPEDIRERDGIPDLRRRARFRYAIINLPEVDISIRKQVRAAKDLDNALTAALIRNLKIVRDGSKIVVMDADTGRSKAIAKFLKKLGVKEPYLVVGGFQAWRRKGLRVKESKPETALTLLNEEAEAILEDIKPSPLLIFGSGLGTLLVVYSLIEWEKTLQVIGVIGLGQTLYRRIASYNNFNDLKRDVRLLLAPVTFGAKAITWVTGKFEPNRIRLPIAPSSTAVQDRVLQAAAKHESQPAEAKE